MIGGSPLADAELAGRTGVSVGSEGVGGSKLAVDELVPPPATGGESDRQTGHKGQSQFRIHGFHPFPCWLRARRSNSVRLTTNSCEGQAEKTRIPSAIPFACPLKARSTIHFNVDNRRHDTGNHCQDPQRLVNSDTLGTPKSDAARMRKTDFTKCMKRTNFCEHTENYDAAIGSKFMTTRCPVASAKRLSVRVDGIILPPASRTIWAREVSIRSASSC